MSTRFNNALQLLIDNGFKATPLREIPLKDVNDYLENYDFKLETVYGFDITVSSAVPKGEIIDSGKGVILCNPNDYAHVKKQLEDSFKKVRQDDRDGDFWYDKKTSTAKVFSLIEWIENN